MEAREMFAQAAKAGLQPSLWSHSSSSSWTRPSVRSSLQSQQGAVAQSCFSARTPSAGIRRDLLRVVTDFDSQLPIESASTPPSSWYTDADLLQHEMGTVFGCGWQVVGLSSQVEKPFTYFTGSLGKVQYIVCRDGQGELHGFHNVCRHHAAPVATGSGCKMALECPYHGWTYSLEGKFQKATRLTGIKDFKAHENGLLPISAASWGPFVLLNFSKKKAGSKVDFKTLEKEWLGDASLILASADIDAGLSHVAQREYILNCNWKVFCDNYLDGGYHVPIAHKSLASGLNLDSYHTQVLEKVSIQSCKVETSSERLGKAALYAFIYPNFMINRYGPWMDTNLVIPLGTSRCLVVFHYFLDHLLVSDKEFIQQSLSDSEVVQMEDTMLCEGVQKGLESPGFAKGRYAPTVEQAMHHFHCLLQRDLLSTL